MPETNEGLGDKAGNNFARPPLGNKAGGRTSNEVVSRGGAWQGRSLRRMIVGGRDMMDDAWRVETVGVGGPACSESKGR